VFEYAEGEIVKRIQELDEQIILYKKEETDCLDDREYILSYMNISDGINTLKKSVIVGNLLGLFLLAVGVMSGNIFVFVSSFTCFSIAGMETFKIIKNNKILKDKYSDISGKRFFELNNMLAEITKRETKLSLQCRNFERCKNYYKIKLDKIDRYKNIFQDVIVNVSKDPYYVANTEEEYRNFVAIKEKCSVLLDNYLDEKVDYSDIHFNCNADDEIKYTVVNKKMMKKM